MSKNNFELSSIKMDLLTETETSLAAKDSSINTNSTTGSTNIDNNSTSVLGHSVSKQESQQGSGENNPSSNNCECGSKLEDTCTLYKKNHRELWEEIVKEYDDKRRETENYIEMKKDSLFKPPEHPEVEYLNNTIFNLLNPALIQLLHEMKKQEGITLTEGEPFFDPLNFLSEYLWNKNPIHPERRAHWRTAREIIWKCRKV